MFAMRRATTVSKSLASFKTVKVSPAFVQRAWISSGPINNGPTPTAPKNSESTVTDKKEINDMISHIKAATAPKLSPTLQKFTLPGKVAVVTGGARGLGANIADALCDVNLGALVIFDVLKQHGEEAVAELSKKHNIPVVFHQVDVRQKESVQAAVDATINQFGKIDVLVASAGIADSNIPAEGYDVEMFRRLIDINLTGTMVCAQAVGNAMIKANQPGSMVFIASMSGHIVNYPQQQSCYNASKAGVIMLSKSLAAEWAKYNIRVNTISPGYMDTALNRVPALEAQKKMWKERTPMNRLGNVDELNNLAVFLVSDASTFVTGSDVVIDGGYCTW